MGNAFNHGGRPALPYSASEVAQLAAVPAAHGYRGHLGFDVLVLGPHMETLGSDLGCGILNRTGAAAAPLSQAPKR